MSDAIRGPLRWGAQRPEPREDPTMKAFRRDRFGQFIHWGLYSIPAGVWDGTVYEFAAEFLPKFAKISSDEWASLADVFSIESFDPRGWARTARAMGARYVTVTTKHHEGFCLWPSKYTDFTVAATPYGEDALGQIIEAYQAEGLAVHLYYSVLDWHHPQWRYELVTENDKTAFDEYLAFARNQLCELAQRYPTVRGFWFDGTWDESVKSHGRWTLEIEQMLKDLVPGAIVNSRLRADDLGARHIDSDGHLMGDFESGFERRLPDPWDEAVTARDWEACMTIPFVSWGYHSSENVARTRKNPAQLVEQIVHATSRGGNLLLNFGPTGDGSLAPFEQEIAHRIGAWFAVNGRAVHGCGPATGWPYPSWGYFTQDASEGTVYATITRVPVSGVVTIEPPAGLEILRATPLDDKMPPGVHVHNGRLDLHIAALQGSDMPTVLRLELTSPNTPNTFIEPNPDVTT